MGVNFLDYQKNLCSYLHKVSGNNDKTENKNTEKTLEMNKIKSKVPFRKCFHKENSKNYSLTFTSPVTDAPSLSSVAES